MFKIKVDTIKFDSLCKEFRRSLMSTAVAPSLPCAGSRAFAMVPAILAELDYEVHMLNAQTEFLNADVEEDVLVKMAPTYETKDEDIVHLVVKPQEELVRSPAELAELAVIGFRPLKSDPCVYIYKDEIGFVILTLLRGRRSVSQGHQYSAQQAQEAADGSVRHFRHGRTCRESSA